MTKKYLIIAFAVSAGVAFGVFSFAPASKMLYIKNNPQYLASADISQTIDKITDKIGDLSNTAIPTINAPKNITEDFTEVLSKQMASVNPSGPTEGETPENTGFSMPNADTVAKEYVKNGLQLANKNILSIKSLNFKISGDNSKTTVEKYLSETQIIINNNLKSETSLFSLLDEINKNNGTGLEKLLPQISAHEVAANQLEEIPVPSDLKDLMVEEIQLLRITANILRALTNVENDPMGTVVAAKQFEATLQNWQELQNKFNNFIRKLNAK